MLWENCYDYGKISWLQLIRDIALAESGALICIYFEVCHIVYFGRHRQMRRDPAAFLL
jgi:hypothetical protein